MVVIIFSYPSIYSPIHPHPFTLLSTFAYYTKLHFTCFLQLLWLYVSHFHLLPLLCPWSSISRLKIKKKYLFFPLKFYKNRTIFFVNLINCFNLFTQSNENAPLFVKIPFSAVINSFSLRKILGKYEISSFV